MKKMTLDEAIIEVREHGILLTLNPIKGRQAIRIIFDALRDYQKLKLEEELEDMPEHPRKGG